jgi:hypothetical protein
MGLAFKNGLMVQNMKGNGKIIKQTVKVSFIIKMETYMKANGKMIKQMDLENIHMQMGPNMKGIGKMIFKMVMGMNVGKMVLRLMVSIKMGKNKEMDFIYGQMGIFFFINYIFI